MALECEDFKLEQRAYVKIRTLLQISHTDIYKDLMEVYNDRALPYSTIVDWARRFSEGRESIEDRPRAGRPISGTSDKCVLEVSAILEEDPHISLVEIGNAVGVSTGTAHAIVHDNLQLRKVCARWVPHALTQAQKTKRVQCAKKFLSDFDRTDSRRLFEIVTGDETWVRYSKPLSKEANKIWIAKGQDPPMIPRHDFRNPKVMYCIFFDSYGPVCQICVPKNTTITGSFYLNECLSEVEKFYHNRRPRTGTRGLRLLHDNARPHKTKLVREKLESMRVVELDHPPYSPDLAPCDFWLFPKLKKHLSGRKFESRAHLGSAIFQYMKAIPREDFKKVFLDWIKRLKLVIQHQGEYFEKLQH